MLRVKTIYLLAHSGEKKYLSISRKSSKEVVNTAIMFPVKSYKKAVVFVGLLSVSGVYRIRFFF